MGLSTITIHGPIAVLFRADGVAARRKTGPLFLLAAPCRHEKSLAIGLSQANVNSPWLRPAGPEHRSVGSNGFVQGKPLGLTGVRGEAV